MNGGIGPILKYQIRPQLLFSPSKSCAAIASLRTKRRAPPGLLVSKAEFGPDRPRLQRRNQIIGKSGKRVQAKRARPWGPAAEQASQHAAGWRNQWSEHLLAIAGAQGRAEVADTVRQAQRHGSVA